jgi:hypothetical protein
MASEGSVEQSRGPMDKNRITRPTRLDERAIDREVRGRQRPGFLGGGCDAVLRCAKLVRKLPGHVQRVPAVLFSNAGSSVK